MVELALSFSQRVVELDEIVLVEGVEKCAFASSEPMHKLLDAFELHFKVPETRLWIQKAIPGDIYHK
jgi:hypothetical protein